MTETDRKEAIKKELFTLTQSFCGKKLNEDYKRLCTLMIEKLSRKRAVPFLRGKTNIWAASIVYAIGSFNFLQDKNSDPYVSSDDIAEFFDAKKSTFQNKAADLKKMFKMNTPFFDTEFATDRMKQDNPLNNLGITEDGFIVSL